MNKFKILQLVIAQLSHDLVVFSTAAKTAHEAATHEQNKPDNKYDTLALEASYVAQGQANRAQEIKQSIEIYKSLNLTVDSEAIRVTSLVTIEADDGSSKTVFIGPVEGGMKITDDQIEIIFITPASPLGKALVGRSLGDYIEINAGTSRMEYEIVEIS